MEIASCAVSLLNDIWVRVEHSLLQKLKSIAVQAVYRQDVNKMWGRVEHLPQKRTSNILAMKKIRKIFVFFKFHFHNDGRPREKSYFEVFSRHEVIYLWVKFQVSLTCPTGFLPTNTTFFTNIWREYFSPNILRVFDQPEVEFSKSGQNWANTRPLLLKTFESSNCVDRHTVHWGPSPPVSESIHLLLIQLYGTDYTAWGWWGCHDYIKEFIENELYEMYIWYPHKMRRKKDWNRKRSSPDLCSS